MIRTFSIIIIVAVLAQAFLRTLWTIDYWVEQADYLAHCENLYRPDFDCGGKCYLGKTIRTSEHASSENHSLPIPAPLLQMKDALMFFEQPLEWAMCSFPEEATVSFPPYRFVAPQAPNDRLFKPPGTKSA